MFSRMYSYLKSKTVNTGYAAYEYGKSKFTFAWDRFETILYGDLKQLSQKSLNQNSIADYVVNTLALKAQQNSNGVSVKRLGLIGGHLAYIVPSSHKQIVNLLNRLDCEPKGRQGYACFNVLARGRTLISDTSSMAASQHRLVMQHLCSINLSELAIRKTRTELKIYGYDTFDLNEHADIIIRSILCEAFLGTVVFSPRLNNIIKKFSMLAFPHIGFPMPSLLRFETGFGNFQKEYDEFSTEFLAGYFSVVEKAFRTYPCDASKNIIITAIIAEIKNDFPYLAKHPDALAKKISCMPTYKIESYLQRPAIRALPSLLLGGENLIKLVYEFAKNYRQYLFENAKPEIYSGLHKEMNTDEIFSADEIIVERISSLKQLDHVYKLHLFGSSTNNIVRYSTNGISELKIPPGSMVSIGYSTLKNKKIKGQSLSIEPNQYPFYPFSTGNRMCPGFKATEKIFKAMVTTMVCYLEIREPELKPSPQSRILKRTISTLGTDKIPSSLRAS